MNQTTAGYLFKCKACGKMHMMETGKPHTGIRLPCAENKTAIWKYKKSEFRYWPGLFFDVSAITVRAKD